MSIANLLEIFMGLFEYIFEELQKEEEEEILKQHGMIFYLFFHEYCLTLR